MNPAFSEAIAGLNPVRRGRHVQARCPAHDDNVASLSIDEADDRVLIKCHRGCDTRDVVAALGLTMQNLFDEDAASAGRSVEDATYDYRSADGQLLYQVVRYRPKDFRVRRPAPGGWSWDLDGVDRVPYRLPDFADATEIIVVEGEKDADRLAHHGLVATSNAGGAGKWRAEWAPLFTGKNVTIIPDNDDPGRSHAAEVMSSLEKYARRVRIVELPGVKPKGDVSDWLDDHSFEELTELLRPSVAPTIDEFIATAAQTPTEDLYEGIIPAGGLVIFVGQPRSFKTMAALQMMFATASGDHWLGERPTRTGSALYVSEEGARAKVAERLSTMRNSHSLRHPIHILHREGITLTGTGWQKVRSTLDEMERPTVVVLDTLAALMDGDENSVADIRTALRPIQALITDYGVTVILVHHINKGGEGRMGNRMRGSSALWGACDGTLGFVRTLDPDGVAEDRGEVHIETKDNDPQTLDFEYQWQTMALHIEERPVLTLSSLIAEVQRRQEELQGPVPLGELRRYFRAGKGSFRDHVEEAENYGLRRVSDGYYRYDDGLL